MYMYGSYNVLYMIYLFKLFIGDKHQFASAQNLHVQ